MNKKYMFRTKEVVEENFDSLKKPECQMDDADDAIIGCFDPEYYVSRKYGARNMWKVVNETFASVASSITGEGTKMITVTYDKEKIQSYLEALLAKLGGSITIDDIRSDYRCVYDIERWDNVETCSGFVYDNLSACTPFDTYMAFLMWCKNVSSDTFDAVFEVNESEA